MLVTISDPEQIIPVRDEASLRLPLLSQRKPLEFLLDICSVCNWMCILLLDFLFSPAERCVPLLADVAYATF